MASMRVVPASRLLFDAALKPFSRGWSLMGHPHPCCAATLADHGVRNSSTTSDGVDPSRSRRAFNITGRVARKGLPPAPGTPAEKKQWDKSVSGPGLLLADLRRAGVKQDVNLVTRLLKAGFNRSDINHLQLYTIAIRAYGAAGDWKKALSTLAEVEAKGLPLDAYAFNCGIVSCVEAGECDKVFDLMLEMRTKGIPPDAVTYKLAVRACDKQKTPEKIPGILKEMKAEGVSADSQTQEAVHRVCRSSPVVREEAVELLNEISAPGESASVTTGRKIATSKPHLILDDIKSAGTKTDARRVSLLVQEATDKWDVPRKRLYAVAIRAYMEAGAWKQVLAVLAQMHKDGFVEDAYPYNCAIVACGDAKNSQKVAQLLRDMETHGIVPDAATYESAMHAYGLSGKPDMAIVLLKAMKEARLAPTQRTRSVATRACDGNTEAVAILDEMKAPADSSAQDAGKDTQLASRQGSKQRDWS